MRVLKATWSSGLLVVMLWTMLSWTANAEPSPSTTPTAPSVNPYGPTVTTTAALTNVGIPEFEHFYYVSRNGVAGFSQLRQTPCLIKYTFNPRWQLNLGWAGVERLLTDRGSSSASGDLVPGVKYVLCVPRNAKASTQSLQLQYKFPISDPKLGLSSGRPDQQLTYFFSQDHGKVHLDVNVWATNLGVPDGLRRIQLGQGIGVTVPVTTTFAYEVEWHNLARAGDGVPAVSSLMHVLYYSVVPNLSLAAGLDLGLTRATPKQTYILGAVYHVGSKAR